MVTADSHLTATEDSCVETAWEVAASVVDPELPMLTLADLGVLREVSREPDGRVVVSITPTYSGCPAMATMRDDLVKALQDNGFDQVEIRIQLSPAWTTDWISDSGRAALAEAGISPPSRANRPTGSIPLTLKPIRRSIDCPRCHSEQTQVVSEFGSTACKAHYRCLDCLEPFDHVKEI